jgi:hypothetical protein
MKHFQEVLRMRWKLKRVKISGLGLIVFVMPESLEVDRV